MSADDARRTRLFALAPADSQTRAVPGEAVSMHSAVTALAPPGQLGGFPEEWQAAILLCQAPRAVAEIAASLHLPLTTVIQLLTELAARGLVHHQPPMTEHQATDVTLLRRIRSGLRAL